MKIWKEIAEFCKTYGEMFPDHMEPSHKHESEV